MLDVGWSELLVIAVVLIVVVGPKDLPPMLRAFARMSRKFSAMAGDFRKQFDDALNEADMGDLRQSIQDVQRLNPVNSLREAMNPLRQAADDLKADIRKSVEAPEKPAAVTLPEQPAAADVAAAVPPAEPKTLVPAEATVVSSTSVLAESLSVPPVDEVIQIEPKAKRKTSRAKTVSVLPDVPAEPGVPAAAPARRRSTAKAATVPALESVAAEPAAAPKPRRKTTPKTDKDKA